MSLHYTATGGNFSRRVEEKEELQRISDRLAAYFAKVRQSKDARNAQIDPAGFMQEIKILEGEVKALKNMYERELDNCRNNGDALKKENGSLQMQCEKSYQLCKDLQDRLDAENGKNGALSDEVKRLRAQANQMEAKYREAQDSASKPNAELEKLRSDLKKCLRELEAVNSRYEQECAARQDAENKGKGALDKMRLAEQVHAKEIADLKARLEAANGSLLEMERKMKANRANVNVEAMLKQVRDAADAELNKFKEDTKRQYEKNIAVLKEQIDEDARLIDKLTREKQFALTQAEDAKMKNAQMEGQIAALQNEIRNLEAQLAQERQHSDQQLQALNAKMKDFQEQLYRKLHEGGGTNADNVMLTAEIHGLKKMLEAEEEGRMHSRGDSRTGSSLPDISKFKTGGNTSRMNSARLNTSRGGSSRMGKGQGPPLGFGLSHARTEYRDKYTTPKMGRRF